MWDQPSFLSCHEEWMNMYLCMCMIKDVLNASRKMKHAEHINYDRFVLNTLHAVPLKYVFHFFITFNMDVLVTEWMLEGLKIVEFLDPSNVVSIVRILVISIVFYERLLSGGNRTHVLVKKDRFATCGLSLALSDMPTYGLIQYFRFH